MLIAARIGNMVGIIKGGLEGEPKNFGRGSARNPNGRAVVLIIEERKKWSSVLAVHQRKKEMVDNHRNGSVSDFNDA